MSSYIEFIDETALVLVDQLPLQSLDSAVGLIVAYVSNVGGWVPDNILDPYGQGAPANGKTEAEVATDITNEEYAKVYDIEFQVTLTVTVQAAAYLSAGLSIPTAGLSMAGQVENYVTNQINNAVIPLRVESVGAQATETEFSVQGGLTTQAVRQAIADAVTGSDKIVDYKTLTLKYAIDTYGLDDTWNVESVFWRADQPINLMIKKYSDNGYGTLDGDSSTIYVFNISPVTYAVVSGAIIE
jgi:hypothetical protein